MVNVPLSQVNPQQKFKVHKLGHLAAGSAAMSELPGTSELLKAVESATPPAIAIVAPSLRTPIAGSSTVKMQPALLGQVKKARYSYKLQNLD